jgi:3-oxoacyl-[acyl-carrier protein] reductase
MKLTDVRALVTGGSSGIGFEIAKQLKERGAEVVLCGRDEAKAIAAATSIGAHAIRADVSVEADAIALVRKTIELLPDYNVLVNNAGFGAFAPLVDLTAEEFFRVWQTNVLGAMLVARESAKHFVGRSYGNIVNISSTAGQRGFANGSAYCASKFALHALTECWRAELRQHNIRVMQVNPSEVLTSFGEGQSSQTPNKPDNPSKLHPSDIARLIASMLEVEDRGFVTESTIWATNPK